MTIGFCPVVVENEKPNGRRQIAVRASAINLADEGLTVSCCCRRFP